MVMIPPRQVKMAATLAATRKASDSDTTRIGAAPGSLSVQHEQLSKIHRVMLLAVLCVLIKAIHANPIFRLSCAFASSQLRQRLTSLFQALTAMR